MQGHTHVVITGNTTGRENRQTGDLTLESIQGRCRRRILHGFGLDRRNGTDNGADLLGGAVAHDDSVVQELTVFFENEVDLVAIVDRNHLFGIADHGSDKITVGSDIEGIGSVNTR